MLIEKAAELLREQLEKLLQGSDSFDQIGRKIKSAKADVIKKYSGVFAPEHIPELSAEEFRSFLLFKNNQHWDSLQRQGPQMTADIVKLRRALATLADESKPLRQRLDQLRPTNGQPMVKHLGRAVMTAILQVLHPDDYGVVNNTAEVGMKALGIWPNFPVKATFGERYEAINSVLLKLSQAIPTNLWTLDMLWWRVQPHVPGGSEIVPLAAEPDTTLPSSPTVAAPASEAAAFALESHLQEFLMENWEQMPMGAEWDLLENNEGDIIGAYYNTDEVGEIDLLAKHKTGTRWLVIELKRRQTSDTTVGQLLRYRSWVREHLAGPGDSVERMIICPDRDLNLRYAIKGLSDITWMTYKVSFTLTPAELNMPKAESTTA